MNKNLKKNRNSDINTYKNYKNVYIDKREYQNNSGNENMR